MKFVRSKIRFGIVWLCMTFIFGCVHSGENYTLIELDGYSPKNWVLLDAAVDEPVCVIGDLNVKVNGSYFLLHPYEIDGVIYTGPSRVLSGLSRQKIRTNNLRDGTRYKICGTLKSLEVFESCESNDCKWYELKDARLDI